MRKLQKMLLLFLAMYAAGTGLGFATYLLISPRAMWISVFTIMPVVAALLIFWYLQLIHCPQQRSMHETVLLVGLWSLLSFFLDAATYIFIYPHLAHIPRNWTFFVDQSPWIWLSYAVLLFSGVVAQWLYVRLFSSLMEIKG